ncbi:MAG: hypothetical protein ACYC6M_14595, partial [Terriglobales bacterium]
MRGRRHKLAVSTFPFLAVLLCAMGSLILVLLVMDRKAHQAAQARARREAAQLAEQSAQSESAQRAELEKKKQQARTEWEQKRAALHANLTREQIELQMQMRKVRDQFGQIAARLRYEQDTSTELRHKVQDQRSRIQAEQQLLATLRSHAGQSETQAKESSKTVQRMTIDLLQMEQALKDLKAARQREQHTFSVVPYHGRRGESRRPIYVECTAEGVIFHPERRAMPVTAREFLIGRDQPGAVPDDVRSEVERRIARQRAQQAGVPGAANATPYLLLLVRPDGINTYGELQAVLKDLTLDFGYEFIDADWVLDFPTDEDQPSAQPWMAMTKKPSPVAAASPRTGGARPVALPAQSAAIATSSAIARGIQTGEGSGSRRWMKGPVDPSGMGMSGAGVRRQGTGPFLCGGTPSGTGWAASAGGSNIGSSGGQPGRGSGGNSLNGLAGLTGGTGSNQAGAGNGLAGNGAGSGNAAGSSLASPGGGRGDGSGSGGIGSGLVRGSSSGRGHPAAMPHPLGSDDEEPGAPGGAYVPGSASSDSPGNVGSDVAGLGTPRALAAGSPGTSGYPGSGSGPGRSAGVGTSSPGLPGGDNAGSAGNNSSEIGSPRTAGSSTLGKSGNGSSQPGGSSGASAGMTGGTYDRQPGSAGPPGSGVASAGGPGQSSSATPGVMLQSGSVQPGPAGSASGNASRSSRGGEDAAFPAIDPLSPRSPPSSRADDRKLDGQREGPPSERPADDAEDRGATRRRRIVNGGGGGAGEPDDSGGAANRFAPPSAPVQQPRKPAAALRPAWLHGGRDWTIYVECQADAVVLYPSEKRFTLAQAASDASVNPLVAAIQQMIARRQSGRRPGDPPFYPQIRLLVRPENVRTFLTVYPALEALPVP